MAFERRKSKPTRDLPVSLVVEAVNSTVLGIENRDACTGVLPVQCHTGHGTEGGCKLIHASPGLDTVIIVLP